MRKGFTLIELLVVIAIIAILAAILFPIFARAREKAQQSACLSNVKQLTLSILMYMDDYDQLPPPRNLVYYTNYWLSVVEGVNTWPYLLQPYVKNMDIYVCPTGKEPLVFPGDPYLVVQNVVTNGGRASSYQYYEDAARIETNEGNTYKKLSAGWQLYGRGWLYWDHLTGTQQTRVPCLSDNFATRNNQWYYLTGMVPYGSNYGYLWATIDGSWECYSWNQGCIHNGVANTGFFDGHAESISHSQYRLELGTLVADGYGRTPDGSDGAPANPGGAWYPVFWSEAEPRANIDNDMYDPGYIWWQLEIPDWPITEGAYAKPA